MLPKVLIPKGNYKKYGASDDIINIKTKKTYKKDDNFNIKDCRNLIDFYKEALNNHEEWNEFNFVFSKTEEYTSIEEFYNEVKNQALQLIIKRCWMIGKRKDARLKWKEIENIKELKEGYLGQVVSIITRLMVKYNAIVVMEDLNFGFKRGRFPVEKQVYQKFEKALIDKLNYLVFKDIVKDEIGGLYKPLQLANKFEIFAKMGKQNGFIFYINKRYYTTFT